MTRCYAHGKKEPCGYCRRKMMEENFPALLQAAKDAVAEKHRKGHRPDCADPKCWVFRMEQVISQSGVQP